MDGWMDETGNSDSEATYTIDSIHLFNAELIAIYDLAPAMEVMQLGSAMN